MGSVPRAIGRVGLAVAVIAAAGVSVVDAASASTPNLTITAAFTRSSYVSGQSLAVRFAIHNSGTAAATGVELIPDSGGTAMYTDVDGMGRLAEGVTIQGGQTATLTVYGFLGDVSATSVSFSGDIVANNANGDSFSAHAPVAIRTAIVHGSLYGDANGNGRNDHGEGLQGLRVGLSYRYGTNSFAVTTGRGGHFTVTVPQAAYSAYGSKKPWVIVPQLTTVGPQGATTTLRAVHPLATGQLKVELHFAKRTYPVGQYAHITVTLTNTGSTPLTGIYPECDHVGDPDELTNTAPAWGQLTRQGSGADLPAHSTRSYLVSGRVTTADRNFGTVVIACDFGYREVYAGARPQAIDRATVPGGYTGVGVNVTYRSGDSDKGLKGTRVVIVNLAKCPLYKQTATTDSSGVARFHHVPVGTDYEVYAFPPKGWKVLDGNPAFAEFIGGSSAQTEYIQVAHGSAKAPAVPTSCS